MTLVSGSAGLFLIADAMKRKDWDKRLPWLRWALQQDGLRRWVWRYPLAVVPILGLWAIAPVLIWMFLMGWLVRNRVPRREPIVRKVAPGGISRSSTDS